MTWLSHSTVAIAVMALLLLWWLGVVVTTVNSRREPGRTSDTQLVAVRDRELS